MDTVEKIRTTFRKAPTLGLLALGALLLAGLLFILAGMRSDPAVTGIVRLDGQPLPKGAIRFVPVEGTPGSEAGAVIREGRYTIPKGLTVGKFKVEIQSTRVVLGRKTRDPLFGMGIDADEAIKFAESTPPIREVGPGHNTLNFDLHEAKPGKAQS